MFRVIRRRHEASPLGAAPSPSRFSDPKGIFVVLYASAAVRCSAWEAVLRGRFDRRRKREVPRSEIEDRLVVEIRSRDSLALVDLRGEGAIQIGAPTAVAHDADHAAGRSLSAFVHGAVPEASGFLYASRFTGHDCVAVFGRALPRLEARTTVPLARSLDFLEAVEEWDVTLTTPASS